MSQVYIPPTREYILTNRSGSMCVCMRASEYMSECACACVVLAGNHFSGLLVHKTEKSAYFTFSVKQIIG